MGELLIGDVFRHAARAVPGRVAAVLDGEALTFAELDARANRAAAAVRTLGVEHRDRVVVWSATDLDAAPVFAGLAKLGVVFVPVNGGLRGDEARSIAASARPALILVDDERAVTGASVAADLGIPFRTMRDLLSGPDPGDVDAPALRETDPHVVFFTSGSTGVPKGVVLSHRVNFLRTHPGALPEPRGAMVCPYPLFHMGAWTIALQQWQARDRVVFTAPDPAAICAAVVEHRATRLNCIPGVWRRILDHVAGPDSPEYDLSSVRFADTGTSATPLELLEEIAALLPNAALRVFYGSTEAGGVTVLEHQDVRRKPGSCGVPSPYAEVRLDERGEVCVRGPVVFEGYFEDGPSTSEALVDGWYHTGDLADVDDEGFFSIVGRARDVLRTGGETVAPPEIESVLARHPAIDDVAVIGLPDVQWGELVCAVVVTAPDAACPDVDAVRAFCADQLAPFKQPRRVVAVERIPRTAATNQVQRRLLVEQLMSAEPTMSAAR